MQALDFSDVFFWIGTISTVLFVVKICIFMLVGGLPELSLDFNAIGETDTSFDFLSIEAILSFLMGFGWLGFTFFSVWKMSIWVSVLAAIFFGVLFASLYAFLMICVKKLEEIPQETAQDYIGAKGKAYTNINAHSEGQAELTINQKLKIVQVINNTDADIAAFTPVKVVNFEENKIFIEIE